MFLVGLTGGIGTGKSFVTQILRKRGVVVVDADEIARLVVQPGKPAYEKIRQVFGNEFFDEKNGGVLLRQKLGSVVFQNEDKRRMLNSIVHPAVHQEMIIQIIKGFFGLHKFVILDIPLLFEVGMDYYVQKTIVVTCNPTLQIKRIIERDKLSEDEVLSRIASQLPTEQKVQKATFVVNNNGTRENTENQVIAILDILNSSWQPWIVRFCIISTIFGVLSAGICLYNL